MSSWDLRRAEEHLLSLELFGMRFGLERMRRLLTVLGSPQERFRAVHVVGTNGKSSTVRFTAALLEAHGVKTGAYLSPHLTTFAERIRVGDEDLTGAEFAAAIQRAATAAAKVDRTSPDGERVTQFELLTAAAFDELARRGVEVAVIEAGLGGRYDATNVLGAEVVVLTNVGPRAHALARPDDRRHRGGEARGRARRRHVGARRPAPEVLALAERTGARIVRPASVGVDAPGLPAVEPRRGGRRRQGRARRPAGRPRRSRSPCPGRLQVVDHDPLTIYDGAHNAPGIAALAESVPQGTVAVLSVLDDKDAAGHAAGAAPAALRRRVHARAEPAGALARDARRPRREGRRAVPSEIEPDPRKAVSRAREIAGEHGTVLATGSIYLVADLLSAPGARRASAL